MKTCYIKFSQKITQNLCYKCLYVIGFWKLKQCCVIVCKYLFNSRIKSDYLVSFVIRQQSLNCFFHVGIAILDMGRAGGRVVRKKFGVFCHENIPINVSQKFSAPFLSHSVVSCNNGKIKSFWMQNFQDLLFMLKRSFTWCDIICLNVS